jgi:hypothetical protein
MLLVVSFTHLYSYNEYYNQYIDQDDANKRVFEDISTGKIYIVRNNFYSSSFSGRAITGNVIVNIISFDPATNSKQTLLPDEADNPILALLFETKYDSTNKKVLLNGFINSKEYERSSKYILNNIGLDYRSLSNKIFILTGEKNTKRTPLRSILIGDKNAREIKKIAELNEKDIWCIDIKDRKIRVIRQNGNDIDIESFEW